MQRNWLKNELPIYFILIVLICLGVLLLILTHDIATKDIGTGLLALFGTFIGAFLAFRLQLLKDASIEEKNQVDALNRALIVLCTQFNHLASTQVMLDRYKSKIDRMFNLPAERDAFDQRQQVEQLAFLIACGKANQILQISIEQARFDAARQAIAERSRVLVDLVQPLLEKHDLNHQANSEDVLEKALGQRIYGTLETATNEVYWHVPETVKSLLAMIDDLHATAKKLYPKRKFVKVEPLENPVEPKRPNYK
jgi:hypothetical protein